MGLDTRAYVKATPEWQEQWVEKVNAQGWRYVFLGLFTESIGQRNYGLASATAPYVGGRDPVTFDEAPSFHQDGLDELPWPGGLVGGMISDNGNGPSFRGKCYDDYVEAVTGQSLYACLDEPWEGWKLEVITEMLEQAVDHPPLDGLNSGFDALPPRDEREALARWFRVCVDNNLVVSGDA